MRVIVTGAEEHQGLAVIRGLGLRGVPVIACASRPGCLGFSSRFATATHLYRPPHQDPQGFVADIQEIIARSGAQLLLPAVESTLAVLNAHRGEIEPRCRLAAPPSEILETALDKSLTLSLADRVGVPAPRTIRGEDPRALVSEAAGLAYPLALKPQGPALHPGTRHRLGFKVRYANSPLELARVLASVPAGSPYPLIQEFVRGVGICVAAVFRHGAPVALFPYARLRELPLSGGVSVVRESIPLDSRLRDYVARLLGEVRWHGVAMVEFKYDSQADRYVLMEINGRFQASTALCIDAGLNLPYLVYCLYSGTPLPSGTGAYAVGVRERWLQGDLLALVDRLLGDRLWPGVPDDTRPLPSRLGALWSFVKDFRPGIRYDEFKTYDWRPGVVAVRDAVAALLDYLRG